jgi:Predicted transcriptional regulator
MINKVETGKRIASLRSKLGYSQAVFAEKLNVSPQAVSKWETGQTLPDIDILLIISWMCRITINEIIDSEEIFVDQYNNVERELIRMNKVLICPECKKSLSLNVQTSGGLQYFECENHHRFNVEDGVVFFNTREIQGELWSLYLRNYEHYLKEVTSPGLPRYSDGEIPYVEVMWREIEKIRPNTIVDIASGHGSGIKYIIERISWPCTVILTDLSFRILSWDRRFFMEEIRNPYVDCVFLACDCANIPLRDGSVDVVLSDCGFESMQSKMMDGFREARRILKPSGKVVYTMSLVGDHNSDNTKKWLDLYLAQSSAFKEMMRDESQWLDECRIAGFSDNRSIKVYDEMPAPDVTEFPFENQVLRWMACHVFVSGFDKI